MNKFFNIAFIITIIFTILFIFLHSDFKGGQESKTENRYLAKMPSFKEFSPSSIEKWINDNIGYRKQFIGIRGYIIYKYLHKSPSEKVILGKNGFTFVKGRMLFPKISLSELSIRKDIKNLILVNDILAKYHKYFIFVLVPNTADIYPEYTYIKNYEKYTGLPDIFDDKLKGKVNYVNLKQPLLNEKKNNPNSLLYYKTDVHWNNYGVYTGYKAILDKMNEIGVFDKKEEYTKIEYIDDEIIGSNMRWMGIDFLPEKVLKAKIINSNIKRAIIPQYIEKYKEKYKARFIYSYENNLKNKNILIHSDSMLGHLPFPTFLANNFKNYIHIMHKHELDNETVFSSNADVLLYQLTYGNGRYTTKLENFIEQHYKPKATISSNNLPKVIENNKSYSIAIKIKNLSEYNLGYDYLTSIKFRLDPKEYNNNNIITFELPENTIVKPGEEFILDISFKADYKGEHILLYLDDDKNGIISNEILIQLQNNN